MYSIQATFMQDITTKIVEKSNGLIVIMDSADDYVIKRLATRWTPEVTGAALLSKEEQEEQERVIVEKLIVEIVYELTNHLIPAKFDPIPVKLFGPLTFYVMIDPSSYEPCVNFTVKIVK